LLILKAQGLAPVHAGPTSWQTFLRAHWGAVAGADFFTTEVWTWRGLATYYTVFVIDLASRRVQIVGACCADAVSAPNANAYAGRFVRSIMHGVPQSDGALGEHHFRRALKEFIDHYHRERNHQELENRLSDGSGRTTRGWDPSASAARRLAELLRASGVITARPGTSLGPNLGHYASPPAPSRREYVGAN
jgi:hypothetical protein